MKGQKNQLRLWIVGGVLLLVAVAYLLSYLNGIDRAFEISEADLGLMRGRLEGIGAILWAWLLDAFGIDRHEKRRSADEASDPTSPLE